MPETKLIFNHYLWDGEWKSDVKSFLDLGQVHRKLQILVSGLLRPIHFKCGPRIGVRGNCSWVLAWMPWKPRFYHLQLFFTWSFLHSHLTHKHSPPEGSGVLGRCFCSTPFLCLKFSPMFHRGFDFWLLVFSMSFIFLRSREGLYRHVYCVIRLWFVYFSVCYISI